MPRYAKEQFGARSHLHGSLDMLVLKALSGGPRHGYSIARWLEDITEDALRIEEGSLRPALDRQERRGWIEAEWGKSRLGRRAKLYHLTARGRAELRLEAAEWERFAHAITRVLLATA